MTYPPSPFADRAMTVLCILALFALAMQIPKAIDDEASFREGIRAQRCAINYIEGYCQNIVIAGVRP